MANCNKKEKDRRIPARSSVPLFMQCKISTNSQSLKTAIPVKDSFGMPSLFRFTLCWSYVATQTVYYSYCKIISRLTILAISVIQEWCYWGGLGKGAGAPEISLNSPLTPNFWKFLWTICTLTICSAFFNQFEGRAPLRYSCFAHYRHFGRFGPQNFFPGGTYDAATSTHRNHQFHVIPV